MKIDFFINFFCTSPDWTNKIIKCPAKDSAGVAITGCYSKVSYMMREQNVHENKMHSDLVRM